MNINAKEIMDYLLGRLKVQAISDDAMFNLGYLQATIDLKNFLLSKKQVGSVHKETS